MDRNVTKGLSIPRGWRLRWLRVEEDSKEDDVVVVEGGKKETSREGRTDVTRRKESARCGAFPHLVRRRG